MQILPIYTSPEAFTSKEYTKASDIYSFAMIFYEIITPEIPFCYLKEFQEFYNEIVKKRSYRVYKRHVII